MINKLNLHCDSCEHLSQSPQNGGNDLLSSEPQIHEPYVLCFHLVYLYHVALSNNLPPTSIFIVHRYHAHLHTEICLFLWIICCKKVSLSDLKHLKIFLCSLFPRGLSLTRGLVPEQRSSLRAESACRRDPSVSYPNLR